MKYHYDIPVIAVEDFERPVRAPSTLRERLFEPLATYLAGVFIMLCVVGFVVIGHYACDATDCVQACAPASGPTAHLTDSE